MTQVSISSVPISRGSDLPAGHAASAVKPDQGRPAEKPSLSTGPNPSLRLDPGLGLVVLEFRDQQGAVSRTLPTERELAAYRTTGAEGGREARQDTEGTRPASGSASGSASGPASA